MSAMLVLTAVGDEAAAAALAEALVERRLAACVNLVPGVRSVYRWRGELCRDAEVLLLVKTTAERLEELAAAIRELHPYELPEILAFEAAAGDLAYRSWIAESVAPGA